MQPMFVTFQHAGKTYTGKVLNRCKWTGVVTTTYAHNGRTLTIDLKPTQYTESAPPPPRPKRAPNPRRLNRYAPQRLAQMDKVTTDGAKFAPVYPKGADDAQRAQIDAHHAAQLRARRLIERRARRRSWLVKMTNARRRFQLRRGLITPPKFRTLTRAEIVGIQRAALIAAMPEAKRAEYMARENARRAVREKARREWRRAQLMKALRARV